MTKKETAYQPEHLDPQDIAKYATQVLQTALPLFGSCSHEVCFGLPLSSADPNLTRDIATQLKRLKTTITNFLQGQEYISFQMSLQLRDSDPTQRVKIEVVKNVLKLSGMIISPEDLATKDLKHPPQFVDNLPLVANLLMSCRDRSFIELKLSQPQGKHPTPMCLWAQYSDHDKSLLVTPNSGIYISFDMGTYQSGDYFDPTTGNPIWDLEAITRFGPIVFRPLSPLIHYLHSQRTRNG